MVIFLIIQITLFKTINKYLGKVNINNLVFESDKNNKKCFYNSYEFLIRNANSDSQNSLNYKKEKILFIRNISI